jgi:hypothetical protein
MGGVSVEGRFNTSRNLFLRFVSIRVFSKAIIVLGPYNLIAACLSDLALEK